MAERPFPDLISWQNLDVCPRWGPELLKRKSFLIGVLQKGWIDRSFKEVR
jgi:hypothetical protein